MIKVCKQVFLQFMDQVKNSFWWNRSVNRAVERTMQTIAPPSFSCHKIVSSMSNNEGGETAIMSRKRDIILPIFSLPAFKRSFLLVCELWQYGLWSFQTGYIKLERFLPKNQQAKRIFLNFENWTNGEPQ